MAAQTITGERMNLSATPPTGNVVDESPEGVIQKALWELASKSAVIEHEIMAVAAHILTEQLPTMAVFLGGDHLVRLQANPKFVLSGGEFRDNVALARFVLAHEAYHILYAHLYQDQSLQGDELHRLACECVINDRVMRHLGTEMPSSEGKPSGVDPKKFYAQYRKAKRAKEEEPVDYRQFVSTDMACRSYLAEIPRPSQPRADFCQHEHGEGQGDGDGQGAAQPGSASIDQEAASTIAEAALGSLMTRALNGDNAAKSALLELGEQVGEDHPLWGNLGLGALRGETQVTAQVKFWEYFLSQALTSILTPGVRMVYPRSLAGLEPLYEEAGSQLPFMPMGDERKTEVAIFIDTSGSMGQALIERVAKLVGEIPNAEAHWCAFDASVWPFEAGEELRGGGGTSFQIIVDYLDGNDEIDPDCVLVLTDGYAPEISPPDSDKWIWLITSGGNTWPMDRGMECIEVDV
jgi:hypothetical protein